MMRTSAAVLAVLLGSVISTASAADITPADKEFFEKNLNKIVKVTPKLLDQPAVSKVIAAKVYQTEVQVGEVGMTMLLARSGDRLINISTPSTDMELPDLKALLDPKFSLTNDASAKTLEAAIDVLYPIMGFGDQAKKAKAIRHKGNEWILVRGKFFKDDSGFVFTTDAKGTITKVKYSLKLPAN
jgi:hypothetical protein